MTVAALRAGAVTAAVTLPPVEIPASHNDLLDRPLPAVLTTGMPDGRLQSTVVWFQRDGGCVLINTMREFQKARNLGRRRFATLLVVEPRDATKWIELRCDVTPDGRDALAHLDALSMRYIGTAPYFGRAVAAGLAAVEHPVVFRLTPFAVRTGPLYARGDRPGPAFASERSRPRPACSDEPTIPASHRDLLCPPHTVALGTRLPGGAAQTQPVWCCLDGNDVLVHATRQGGNGRNLAADPRATVLAVDPGDSGRWIEIRGDVEPQERVVPRHRDDPTRAHTGHSRRDGTAYPAGQRRHETLIARIHPRRITCDAIHR
jgi:hypothetical protein